MLSWVSPFKGNGGIPNENSKVYAMHVSYSELQSIQTGIVVGQGPDTEVL